MARQPHWAKVAHNLDANPKIRRARALGRQVFEYALRRNADPDSTTKPGYVDREHFEPVYMAGILMLEPAESARGLELAIAAGLLSDDPAKQVISIVGWGSEWGKESMTEAERKRLQRTRVKTPVETSPDSGLDKRPDNVRTSLLDLTLSSSSESPDRAPQVPISDKNKISKKKTHNVDGPKKRQRPGDPTPAELASVKVVLEKLQRRNGVAYQQSKEHTRLIIARLRDGCTEMDLRAVIGYCALELEWATKENMRAYLRPETLFGPETIHRYLDAARSWLAKIPTDQDGQKRPGATIHRLPLSLSPPPENVAPSERQAAQEELQRSMATLFPNYEGDEDESADAG